MANKNKEIEFYTDCLIVECLLSDSNNTIIKNAGINILNTILDPIKNFFEQKIDKENKTASFLAFIAPYGVYKIFDFMGFKWIKYLMGLVTAVFNKDIKEIIAKIYDYIKNKLVSEEKLTSEEIKNKVNEAVDSELVTSKGSSSKPSSTSSDYELFSFESNYLNSKNINFQLRNAKLVKLALISYKERHDTNPFLKNAGLTDSAKSFLQGPLKEALKKFLYWFFVISLSSVGFLVAGDAVNKFLGRDTSSTSKSSTTAPSTATTTTKTNKPSSTSKPAINKPTTTQKKFKVKSTYKEENKNQGKDVWEERYTADLQSIKRMVLNFAKDVYQGLDNLDNVIMNTAGFETVVNNIYHANRDNLLAPITIIPIAFTSKKDIVDLFIDEVAENVR